MREKMYHVPGRNGKVSKERIAAAMVKQGDIARRLNISRTTVARAFSGKNVKRETQERVFDMAKRLGYVHNSAATSLALKSSKRVIAFIIKTIDEGYSNQMEEGIRDVLHLWNGYNFEIEVQLTDINGRGDKCREQMDLFHDAMKRGCDGVIFSALSDANSAEATSYCRKHDIPLMTLDLLHRRSALCHIGPSYYDFGGQSAAYLAGLVRKRGRILTLSYDDGYQLSATRMRGFFDKLREYPAIECRNVDVRSITEAAYRKALAEHLPGFAPDAVYAPYKMDNVAHALLDLWPDRDVVMISNGINRKIEDYLFGGVISGIVSVRPYQLGAVAANNFFKYFYRATEMLHGDVDVGCDIYIKENYQKVRRIL